MALAIRKWLPAALLDLALVAASFLAFRTLQAEQDAARLLVLRRLSAEARDLAGRVEVRVSLARGQAEGDDPVIWVEAGGGSRRPTPPPRLRSISPPLEGDAEGSFYLKQGDDADRAQAEDADRAVAFWTRAAAPERAPAHRALALHRLAAHALRSGQTDAALEFGRRGLATLASDDRHSLEALALAEAAGAVDSTLRAFLISLAGGEDAEAGRIWLTRLAPEARSEFDLRAREFERARLWVAEWRLEPRPPAGAEVFGGQILAWQTRPDRSVSFGHASLPALPSHLEVDRHSPPSQESNLEAAVHLGPGLPGFAAKAKSPPDELQKEVARRQALVICTLLALAAGSLGAFALGWRAVRTQHRAAEERVRFVTQVGHDLRTPLARIRLYAETLAAGRVKDEGEARRFAAIAARDAVELSRRVETVLDLARIDTVALHTQFEEVDLCAIAVEVLTAHEPLLHEAGIRSESRVPKVPVRVLGHEGALKGALQNMIENVRHHARSGGYLGLSLTASEKQATLSIEDRGPGLPAELGDRVFARFVRGPHAPVGGIGLGLALVREVAESHGGHAVARAREGGGAIVSLLLPRIESKG